MVFAKCKDWFASNAKADEWASKLVLVLGFFDVEKKFPYLKMTNAPCWSYVVRSGADGADAVTRIMTTYSGGCWYGVCRHHAYVYTAIFQERVKGQYHTVSGYHIKAMNMDDGSHAWAELYIKGMGYYIIDVSAPQYALPRRSFGERKGDIMCNRWVTGNKWQGAAPYERLWAGPEIEPPPTPPEPTKAYIKATTSPTGAQIWLKKH